MFDANFVSMLLRELGATLYMTLASTAISYLLGLPLGVLLVTSEKGGLKPMRVLNQTLNVVVNILRSVPFLILILVLVPVTRAIVGTSIGSTATIVPLVIGATPFVGRLVEGSLREVDRGVVEAAVSMGASPWQIVRKVLLPEALPSLVTGAALATITILGYSAMAGAVGGGGLGNVAIMYGSNRYQFDVMIVCVIILVCVVQLFELIGRIAARAVDKRK